MGRLRRLDSRRYRLQRQRERRLPARRDIPPVLSGTTGRHSPGERLEYLAGVFYLRSSWDSIESGELFPSSSFAPLGLRVGVEDAAGRWGVALIGRNVTTVCQPRLPGRLPIRPNRRRRVQRPCAACCFPPGSVAEGGSGKRRRR